jgi:hypothetical protein
MLDQRRGHVLEHGFAVAARAVQFSTAFLVTHGVSLKIPDSGT